MPVHSGAKTSRDESFATQKIPSPVTFPRRTRCSPVRSVPPVARILRVTLLASNLHSHTTTPRTTHGKLLPGFFADNAVAVRAAVEARPLGGPTPRSARQSAGRRFRFRRSVGNLRSRGRSKSCEQRAFSRVELAKLDSQVPGRALRTCLGERTTASISAPRKISRRPRPLVGSSSSGGRVSAAV